MIRGIGLMGGRQARLGRQAGEVATERRRETTGETHSTNHHHINISSLSHQATRIGNRIIRSYSLNLTQ
jgi:hypothetical protein